MTVRKEDMIKLFELLSEDAKQSAYDYLQFLSICRRRADWGEIVRMEPDDIPLSEEEERQLKNNAGFVSWEEAMRELNLCSEIETM
jgi:ribonucleotide reductase alpha subunit